MFYKYLISNINNEKILYLFVENNYEFAQEFNKKDDNISLKQKIKKYIEENKINFSGKKIFLVINGLIIGSLLISNNNLSKINKHVDIEQIINRPNVVTIFDDELIDVVKNTQ